MHDIPPHLTPWIKKTHHAQNNYTSNILSYTNPLRTSHQILLFQVFRHKATHNIGNQCPLRRILQQPLTFQRARLGMCIIIFLQCLFYPTSHYYFASFHIGQNHILDPTKELSKGVILLPWFKINLR